MLSVLRLYPALLSVPLQVSITINPFAAFIGGLLIMTILMVWPSRMCGSVSLLQASGHFCHPAAGEAFAHTLTCSLISSISKTMG